LQNQQTSTDWTSNTTHHLMKQTKNMPEPPKAEYQYDN